MATKGIAVPREGSIVKDAVAFLSGHPVVAVAIVCLAAVVYAAIFLQGTWLGFALAFGGGAIVIECLIVLQSARRKGR